MSTSYERCPQTPCLSHTKKSLSVTTKPDGSRVWNCHRCGWAGLDCATHREPQVPKRNVASAPGQAVDPIAFWRAARPVERHPYLSAKRVKSFGLCVKEDRLVIPVRRRNRLVSCQTIAPDGFKLFLKGCRMAGGYHSLGTPYPGDRLWLCEGYATAAALHEYHDGEPVLACFSAKNLMPVARAALGAGFSHLRIMADDDQWTDGNPGMTAAMAVNAELGVTVSSPDWEGIDMRSKPTDFNDFWRLTNGG